MPIKVTHKTIMAMMFFIALIGGFQTLKYVAYNRMQELSMGVTLMLFLYSAWFASRNLNINWNLWFFGPIMGIAAVTCGPAYIFSMNNGVDMLPSVLSNRAMFFYLLAPSIVFMYGCGFTIEELEWVIVRAIATGVVLYIFFYITLPFPSYYGVDDPWKKSLVSFDFRGYRLKIPFKVMAIGASLFIINLFLDKQHKFKWLVLTGITLAGLLFYGARSINAGIVASLFFYLIFLNKQKKSPFFLMMIPIMLLGQAYGISSFFEYLAEQNAGVGKDIRFNSYQKALEVILAHPLLGMGMSSAATITDSKLIWKYFFADDIGVVGIAYRYGLVGALVYLSFAIKMFANQITLNWRLERIQVPNSGLQIALLCTMINTIMNLILNVDFVIHDGVVFASLIIGLNTIYNHRYFRKSTNSESIQQAQTV